MSNPIAGFSADSMIDQFKEIAEKISSKAGVTEILQQIADSASIVLDANPIVLFQFDRHKGSLTPPPLFAGQLLHAKDYAETFVFTGDTFAERILSGGESIYFESEADIDSHSFMAAGREEDLPGRPKVRFHHRERIKSMAALVLKADDEPVGLMFVNYREPQSFTAESKKLMDTFASYAAVAIKNSRLIERLRQLAIRNAELIARLRQSRDYLRQVIQKTPDPVFVTENKKVDGAMIWRIEVANEAAHQLFGYQFRARELENLDARQLLAENLTVFDKALREGGGEVSDFETTMPDKYGKPIPISISTAILEQDEQNHVTRTICLAKDLTKRKELERQLEHLNQATLSLLKAEDLNEAYKIVFDNLSHIGYDKGMISLLDATNNTIVGREAMGKGWRQIARDTRVPLAGDDILAQVIKQGKPVLVEDCGQDKRCGELMRQAGIQSQYVIPLIVQDDVIGTLQIGLSDKQDLIRGDKFYRRESLKILAGFANQVAVAIHANQKKIAINKLERTLADIGHEFRSPLHNINAQLGGLIYYLKKMYGEDDRVRKVASIIEEETFRAERNMRNALFSAGEAFERRGVHFEPAQIGETVISCAQRFKQSARKRGINIVVYDSVKKLPVTVFDRAQLEQVFSNLIDNAIKYSYANQNIEITGAEQEKRVTISIKDLGTGIPKRSFEDIFKGFKRSDIKDPTRFIAGTGLGLQIAKRIVEVHKGKIKVSSEPYFKDPRKIANYEGYSTVFTVVLPRNPKES